MKMKDTLMLLCLLIALSMMEVPRIKFVDLIFTNISPNVPHNESLGAWPTRYMYSGNEICFFHMVPLVSLFSNSQQPDSFLLNLTRITPHRDNPGNGNGSFLCAELDKPLSSTLDASFSSFTLALTALSAVEAECVDDLCWVELVT